MVKQQQCIDYAVYVAVRLAVAVIQALPLAALDRWSYGVGRLMTDVLKIRRRLLDENLRCAFPELPADARLRLMRAHWRHLFLIVCEVAHAPRKIHETNWRDHFELHDIDRVIRALLTDRPTVVVSGHFGNFEIAGHAIGLLGFPSFSIARPLDNPYVDNFLNQFRRSKRRIVLPKVGSAREATERLDRHETLSLLGDQSAGPNGCWVRFFHRPASAHKAIALFCLSHGAPMVVCGATRSDGPLKFDIRVTAVADPHEDAAHVGGVRELTQWYTDRLEDLVRRAPEQYWWVHNRWKYCDLPQAQRAMKRRVAA